MNRIPKRNRLGMRNEEGFAIIGLLVVLVIIGVLAAIAIPIYNEQQKKAIGVRVVADARSSVAHVEAYLINHAKSTDLSAVIPVVSGDNDVRVSGGYDDYRICVFNANGDPSWAEYRSTAGRTLPGNTGEPSLCGREVATPLPTPPTEPSPTTPEPSAEPTTPPSSPSPAPEPTDIAQPIALDFYLWGTCGNKTTQGSIRLTNTDEMPAGTRIIFGAYAQQLGTITVTGGAASVEAQGENATVTLTENLAANSTLIMRTGLLFDTERRDYGADLYLPTGFVPLERNSNNTAMSCNPRG